MGLKKGQRTTDNRQQTTDNGQQKTDDRKRTTDNRQQTTDNRQRTTVASTYHEDLLVNGTGHIHDEVYRLNVGIKFVKYSRTSSLGKSKS